jgi:hypothetical protein
MILRVSRIGPPSWTEFTGGEGGGVFLEIESRADWIFADID